MSDVSIDNMTDEQMEQLEELLKKHKLTNKELNKSIKKALQF